MTFTFSPHLLWILTGSSALFALLVALAVHHIGALILRRLTHHRPLLSSLVKEAYTPARWTLITFAVQLAWHAAPDSLIGIATLRDVTRLIFIGTVTWLATRCCTALGQGVRALYPVDSFDNLAARRIHTQTHVLTRCVNVTIFFVGVAVMLMTFPEVRQIGMSLMASAGVVGVVAGLAARPVLGNLIAGLQIAITQPIRIDDVLVVEGEWGRVQEITGTYVVVRLWDERRFIVPLQWFIENPFQNWTHNTSSLVGAVFLWLDYHMPLEPLRLALQQLCEQAEEWDKRVCLLQVTDTTAQAMQIRVAVSAKDASGCWNLRCKVREGLIDFVQRYHANCLPRLRTQWEQSPPIENQQDAAPKPSFPLPEVSQ